MGGCSSCAAARKRREERAARIKAQRDAKIRKDAEDAKKAGTNGRSVTASGRFRLTTTAGASAFYGSRLEAEAARVRAGGGTITDG